MITGFMDFFLSCFNLSFSDLVLCLIRLSALTLIWSPQFMQITENCCKVDLFLLSIYFILLLRVI